MKELIEKLTSYNLFNYLLPGTVFVVLAENYTSYSFIHKNLFVVFFAYYFIGMVISRVGSLTVEPLLRKVGFVEFAPYEDFVRCSEKDQKLEVLSESNNTYRTLATVFIALGFLKLVEIILTRFSAANWVAPLILCTFLFGLFLLSYRKQTAYIKKRIDYQRN